MDRAPFFSRTSLCEFLLRAASVIVLSAAVTAHAATDGLQISGTPPTSATMGQTYHFTPTVSDPGKRPLQFHIWNKPSWATFNTTTGQLAGTPTATNVGSVSYPTIFVTDGLDTALLPRFTLTVFAPAADKPAISGTPPTLATAGQTYSFTPTVSNPAKLALRFGIWNKPTWATFNATTGGLAGTPTAANVGSISHVTIFASDGADTTALPAFSITVKNGVTSTPGSATLSWQPPTENTNGSALTNLAGIRIYYGTSASNLGQTVVAGPGQSSYTIGNLAAGVWYFAARAYANDGTQSALTSVVSKSIR